MLIGVLACGDLSCPTAARQAGIVLVQCTPPMPHRAAAGLGLYLAGSIISPMRLACSIKIFRGGFY